MNKVVYPAYGKWAVTTEGDCEGRTVKNLGVHEGYIDEIAFALGHESYYSLRFSLVKELPKPALPKVAEVSVSLDIDSGTWDMTPLERVVYFRDILQERDVIVKNGTFYASVVLCSSEERREDVIRQQALEKLTSEEKKVLGL